MRIDELLERDNAGRAGNFVSLFSGAGGMDIGFYRAGFTPVWSNDIDPVAVKTYSTLFPNHEITQGNIRNQKIPDFNGVDLVIGGPPCQGFSVAGKMDPNDPRSRHVWDFLAIVQMLQPRVFVMENVKALAKNSRWQNLLASLIQEAESKLNYKTKLFLLNAADYGVPQARERMFLIGTQDEINISINPITANNSPTVQNAIGSLPRYGTLGNNSICLAKITPAKKPVLRKSPFAGMLFNGQGRPLDLNKPALTLPASMGGNRTPIIDQNQLECCNGSWVTEYHAHLLTGGNPVATVPDYLRRITVEEAAAIQTFPNRMIFAGKQSSQYRQIGNAVPPLLAYHVAVAVRNALANAHA